MKLNREIELKLGFIKNLDVKGELHVKLFDGESEDDVIAMYEKKSKEGWAACFYYKDNVYVVESKINRSIVNDAFLKIINSDGKATKKASNKVAKKRQGLIFCNKTSTPFLDCKCPKCIVAKKKFKKPPEDESELNEFKRITKHLSFPDIKKNKIHPNDLVGDVRQKTRVYYTPVKKNMGVSYILIFSKDLEYLHLVSRWLKIDPKLVGEEKTINLPCYMVIGGKIGEIKTMPNSIELPLKKIGDVLNSDKETNMKVVK